MKEWRLKFCSKVVFHTLIWKMVEIMLTFTGQKAQTVDCSEDNSLFNFESPYYMSSLPPCMYVTLTIRTPIIEEIW